MTIAHFLSSKSIINLAKENGMENKKIEALGQTLEETIKMKASVLKVWVMTTSLPRMIKNYNNMIHFGI